MEGEGVPLPGGCHAGAQGVVDEVETGEYELGKIDLEGCDEDGGVAATFECGEAGEGAEVHGSEAAFGDAAGAGRVDCFFDEFNDDRKNPDAAAHR